jgi:hypothetical protein
MSRMDMDRIIAITPPRKPGEKWCKGRDGHEIRVQEAHITQTT